MPDAAIRSIEFIDARDQHGKPVRVGIGTTESNKIVILIDPRSTHPKLGKLPPQTVVVPPGQMPRVQKLMREAYKEVIENRHDDD
jgi:hypothetical protein